VHFSGAFTAYGPIRASDEGVAYFTLRNGFDPGARFMTRPENRAALRAQPGRQHREAVAGPLQPNTPSPSAKTQTEALLGPAPDGMAAWRYRVAPGEMLAGPDPAQGRGQYWLVVAGALHRDGETLPPMSCCFVSPHEGPFSAEAGSDGLDVLVMQFPHRTDG
jgi:hypothetical protein